MAVYFKCKRDQLRKVLNQLRGSISHSRTKGMTLPLTIEFAPKSISLISLHQSDSIEAICDKEAKVEMPFRIMWKALADHSSENFTGLIKEGNLKIGTYEANDEQIHFIKG